jgi:hypothetical protein
MAILKHRPTLANWQLVSSFLSCAFFACQGVSHLKDMLGACLGLLMLSVFSLPYLLLFLAELVIVLLVLTPFFVLLFLLFRHYKHQRAERAARQELVALRSQLPKPSTQPQENLIPWTQRRFNQPNHV